jgi:hypothetical protein
MWRSVLGVVVGVVAWMVAFYALAFGLAALWHDFALHGQEFFRTRTFTFTPLMGSANLVFWVLAEIVAGWVAMKIALRHQAVWVLAGLLGLYLAYQHLWVYWSSIPWWYNLGVVIPSVFAVLLGARLARGSGKESIRFSARV